ncbi:hypothetical protein SRABI106_04634 [Rahnella aquatilis]|nr:hypothetical protein SRABI106_04634 [Rahnella aquatilis]
MRNRCQVWRISFYQQTIQRDVTCHFTQRIGITESHNSGERDIKTQIEQEFCGRQILGKAMEYTTALPCFLFFENIQCILAGITGMDDHRFVQLAANTDVLAERVLLQFQLMRFFLIKIIQTGFPHRHHFRAGGKLTQLVEIVTIVDIQRMNTAGKCHVRAITNQLRHCPIARQGCCDGQHKFHITFAGFFQHTVHA